MYRIDKDNNCIHKIEEKTFSDLNFKERQHLQEWIAKDPSCLGEELLIISKEFNGFADTGERLDLLALDKKGNLVIIENKLDSSGKDVTWQALKYTSYCSSLSKEDIEQIYQDYIDKNGIEGTADNNLSKFYDEQEYEDIVLNKGLTQRIILVAREFRKEVTSTVLWLMNYNLRIQCFKAVPFQDGERLYLNIEQIIPLKDAEDYVIKMAAKAQKDMVIETKSKERSKFNSEFWNKLLRQMNSKSDLFNNTSSSAKSNISTGITGLRRVGYEFVISAAKVRVALYIDTPNQSENKRIFDRLYAEKEKIEQTFENKLLWERKDDNRVSKIAYEESKNINNIEEHGIIIDTMISLMINLEKSLREHLLLLKEDMECSKTYDR